MSESTWWWQRWRWHVDMIAEMKRCGAPWNVFWEGAKISQMKYVTALACEMAERRQNR